MLVGIYASNGPTVGKIHSFFRIRVVGSPGSTLVERHNNIRSEIGLYFHHRLRCEKMSCAIEMGSKFHSILRDFHEVFLGARSGCATSLSERKNLESSAVRKHGKTCIHERMHSSEISNDLVPWPHGQMVSIREKNLRSDRLYLFVREAFYRSLGPDRHKYRGLYGSMRGDERSGSGSTVFVIY